MSSILIIGGNSDIGYATSKVFAQNKYNIHLASRNVANLKIKKEEIEKLYNVDCKISISSNTKLMVLRQMVAQKMEWDEKSITMNPNLETRPDGVSANLLWSKGYFAERTQGNLELTLADLNYDKYDGNSIYLGAFGLSIAPNLEGINQNCTVVVSLS